MLLFESETTDAQPNVTSNLITAFPKLFESLLF
jgi:hypothetical protein